VLDLETAQGRVELDALLDGADIWIENLGPAGHERLGLVPTDVERRHPNLVVVSMADFGLSGPLARWRAEPLVAFAMSGAHYASGFPDLPPCWLPGYVAHDSAGVFAAGAAVAALFHRNGGGAAQRVEV
jgi:crotonobetainyl-CoA:carnitine CoA-transferase CaiB-like acyl-CoA transferase